ncbi:alpha/beta hydrolase [Flammeovirga sp. EKP202]|uniref:alpha/beta hydrolase n=1 Tax=Flammeovirga sp. EKP202 TaxID=2770592 RepID=UPI00165F2492|nr:alpha/beta hydrolase-fold protein [Flammeovirga sp. EKP202]MBD0404399.1 alpha/beta hydrolase [Flammeovirga sp. EKP202]
MYRKRLIILLLFIFSFNLYGQDTICVNQTLQHKIDSKHLDETRAYWVSLPLHYTDTLSYPVIYVFDAEWRFDLIRHISFDLGANKKIQNAIVVGIPHVEMENKRGQDLTFSQSRIEYDGEAVDSTWYNTSNSGSGMNFYHYLVEELIPDVNKNYSTNQHETLIGHSYGGYFGAYLLSLEHPFEVIHIYDPSIWYSNGEVVKRFNAIDYNQQTKIHLTYQPVPAFHKEKIEEFKKALEGNQYIELTSDLYKDDTHNSLFLDSFYKGIMKTNQK